MQVALWVGTMVVFWLSQALMIMAWAMAGVLLRYAQEEVVGTKLFGYMRVLGFRKLLTFLIIRRFRKLVRERCKRDWRKIGSSILTVLAAASLPVGTSLVSLLFTTPFLIYDGITSALSARTVIISDVLGVIPGVWFWIAGLDYAASAGTRGRSGLPRLEVPSLARTARDDLALRIYCYEGLKWLFVWAMESPLILLVIASIGTRAVQTTELSDLFAVVALFAGQAVLLVTVKTVVDRRMAFDHALSGICFLLASTVTAKTAMVRQGALDGLIVDPLSQRDDLAKLVGDLSNAAWALDARQVRGTAPHPVATLLRAASEQLRQFLRSEESWSASLPAKYTELLYSVVRLLSMPGDPGLYTDLVGCVPAFKSDGQPADEPGSRPPGRLATIASRATSGIQGTVSAITGIVTIAIIVIVWALFALHRVDILGAVSRTP